MKINYFHENKLFSYNVNFKARCKPVACFDSYKCTVPILLKGTVI